MFGVENRKIIWLVITVTALLVWPGCFGSRSQGGSLQNGNKAASERPGNPQALVRCPLSGEMVPEDAAGRRPLAVMVENAPEARPQSGLDRADVVYEILTEGAITRFLAVYLHGEAEELGPVRSIRPYYIERGLEYKAVFAFCGGSTAAQEMVRREGVASLDEFTEGRQAYWRVKGRKSPHNLYTSTNNLRQAGARRGYERTVKLPEFLFLQPGEENPAGITTEKLVVNYPRNFSLVRWEYDPKEKVYRRYQGGVAHRDAVTGKQLSGTNIIIQDVNTKIIDQAGRLEISMVGRGRALLFTGGKVYSGTWSKMDRQAQTFFYGDNGEAFKLNPGQTWIEVVPKRTKVEY